MDKVNDISNAYNQAFTHEGISFENKLSFSYYSNNIQVDSEYQYGEVAISVDTHQCVLLDFGGVEASAFDYEDEISYSQSDENVYFKLFSDYTTNQYDELFYNQLENKLIIAIDNKNYTYNLKDLDDAKSAYFQLSTMFSNLISEEEFVNQFIAFFKLQDIMKTVNPDFSITISLDNRNHKLQYSDYLDNLKYPKVEFV